jgi:hypothetical protein
MAKFIESSNFHAEASARPDTWPELAVKSLRTLGERCDVNW